MSAVEPDREQIAQFARAAFAEAPAYSFVTLRSFYDDKPAGGEPPFQSSYIKLDEDDDLEYLISQAYNMAVVAAQCPRPVNLCPSIATYAKRGTSKAADLAAGLALTVECDERAEDAKRTLSAILGPPSLTVASGGEWANPETGEVEPKFHLHWVLQEAAITPDDHKSLRRLRALACDLVDADGTSKATVHPLRWPGTVHCKDKANPRLCCIVETTDTRLDLHEALAELEGLEALRDSVKAEDRREGGASGDSKPLSDDLLKGCAERIPNDDLEWAEWNRLAMAFWRASEGSEAGFAAFDEWSAKSEKHDTAVARARWQHFKNSPPDKIGAGTLVFLARQTDPSFLRRRHEPREAPASAWPSEEERPCWRVHEQWIERGSGKKIPPGVYYHTMSKGGEKEQPAPIDKRVCAPLYLDALTRDGEGGNYGLLLRFLDRDDDWRTWAMPFELLKGSGEELRGLLLDMGLDISVDARHEFNRYLQRQTPNRKVTCTTRTGWMGRGVFVLPGEVIGPRAATVVIQTGTNAKKQHGKAGTLDDWRETVAERAVGNPMLAFGISCAFTGPILEPTNSEGGGVHLIDDSSSGKTTILECCRSVWGGKEFKRSWRATSNGVEGVAEMHNDLPLPLDEISEVSPQEAGAISYMVANGTGKSRATRTGAARDPKKWLTIILSTGERSLLATMAEARMSTKAGQSIRLLDIPARRRFGCFDDLHGMKDGRAFSDALKLAAKENFGTAGRAFLERLTRDEQDLGEALAMAKQIPELAGYGGQEGRAAARFALIGMAGELATEYGLTGWPEGMALDAAVVAFRAWLSWRGIGDDEPRKIREAVRGFLDRHGGSRFINAMAEAGMRDIEESRTSNRAGYYKPGKNGERLYYFNKPAMIEAGSGFDHEAVVAALLDCGALIPGSDRPTQQSRISGENARWYVINPEKLGG